MSVLNCLLHVCVVLCADVFVCVLVFWIVFLGGVWSGVFLLLMYACLLLLVDCFVVALCPPIVRLLLRLSVVCVVLLLSGVVCLCLLCLSYVLLLPCVRCVACLVDYSCLFLFV